MTVFGEGDSKHLWQRQPAYSGAIICFPLRSYQILSRLFFFGGRNFLLDHSCDWCKFGFVPFGETVKCETLHFRDVAQAQL